LYNIVFYTAERGDSPLDDFLDGLDKKSRAKVAADEKRQSSDIPKQVAGRH
jgi:hypothetical protein